MILKTTARNAGQVTQNTKYGDQLSIWSCWVGNISSRHFLLEVLEEGMQFAIFTNCLAQVATIRPR